MARRPDMEPPAGLDTAAVTDWLSEAVGRKGGELVAPLDFSQITGGRSNLTFEVTDRAGTRWALRRPPVANVLATAHDMAREHRVMSALWPTPVPVPRMVGLCEDAARIGAPFFAMDWVEGSVVRTDTDAEKFSVEVRQTMGRSVVNNLAEIHNVDIDAVGLGDFAKRDGYIERQLNRWKAQVDATSTPSVRAIERGHAELLGAVPGQGSSRLIHGDYRLDNTIVDAEGHVLAVLDWELATLGDPLADLGAMLTYWTRPGDLTIALPDPPTFADGFIERDEVVAIYQDAVGADVKNVRYYYAFATWRLACILDGVVDRYRAGAMGVDNDFDPDVWALRVTSLAETALDRLADVDGEL